MDPNSRVEGTHFEQLPGYQMPAVAAAVYEESLGLQRLRSTAIALLTVQEHSSQLLGESGLRCP